MDLGYWGGGKTGHKEEKSEGKLGLKRQDLTFFLSIKTAFLAIIANVSNVIKYLLHRKIKSYIGQTILYQPHKLYFGRFSVELLFSNITYSSVGKKLLNKIFV